MAITTPLETLMINHRELVEIEGQHADALDSFRDDDSNWINDEDGSNIPKTGELSNKYDFLTQVWETQIQVIDISRMLIANRISHIEDAIGQFEMDFPA